MMTCRKCGLEKLECEFPDKVSRGRPYKGLTCRECIAVYMAEYWEARPIEKKREVSRKSRARRAVKCRAYSRQWARDNPEKRRAQNIVNKAVRRGVMVRPSACLKCGRSDRRIEASHTDYSKPKEVEWLCAPCHRIKDNHPLFVRAAKKKTG